MSSKSIANKVKVLIPFLLLLSLKLSAQSYNFTNYSLKEGLPQSQVNVIYQAKDRTLWLGTYGGLSNFDGKTFTSYSKADGLISNSVTCVVEDNDGQILIGTEAGLNILKSGKITTQLKGKGIYQLKKDKEGGIWGINEGKLFKLEKGRQQFYPIGNTKISALANDNAGNLFVAAAHSGIYKLENNSWLLYKEFPAELSNSYISKILFDRENPKKMFLLSSKSGLYVLEHNAYSLFFADKSYNFYYSIEQDNKGNIWLGTEKGAYLINKNKIQVYFNAANGLSDNRVNEIFCDAENNIWLSCFSEGIFKYEGDAFIRYNKFKGKDLAYAVSGIGADKNENLWIGTFNKGLLKYDGKNVEAVNTPELRDRTIYFVYQDTAKNIWISAQDKGIWKYNGTVFTQIIKPGKFNYNGMILDDDGAIWLNGPLYTLYIKNGISKEIPALEGMPSSIYSLNKDSVLIGTSTGIFLVRNKKVDKQFEINLLNGAYVLAIVQHGNNVVFATLGDGIVVWNKATKKAKRYVISDGLNSNDIYSVALDNYNNLWVGTGRGINKLSYNKESKKYDVFSDNPLIIECNQNAILNYKNNILVGTINGLIRCKTNIQAEKKFKPFIQIQQINVQHKNDPAKDLFILPETNPIGYYQLKSNQNHIAISFKSVYLTNPQAVLYRYKLIGIDTDFGKLLGNNEVEYSGLRPGNYTFQVYALANKQKSNIASFSFTISPPFYDTIWFKSLALLLIIILIWLAFYLIFKNRERKKQQHEKIKLVEQAKIRKQTAEDFHDDIGNKLTRINVLSEILDKKVEDSQPEQKELIKLIRENANLLYTGTKDILWALDPQSDNLFEILQHIKNFGIDLFQNTGIEFKMEGVLPAYRQLQLSMEFNRNLTLIFKEMLNNALKHSKAKNVLIMVIKTENDTINILTTDDGIGFDLDSAEKGRGLKNIQTRCKRIKSTFNISSIKGKGTTTTISTRIPVTK